MGCAAAAQNDVAREDAEMPQAAGAKATGAAAKELTVCIQFCSDMHLEMPLETKRFGEHLHDCLMTADPDMEGASRLQASTNVVPRVKQGSYLALLGDVFNGPGIRDGKYKEYLLQQCVGFEAVFVLAGNHEFYAAEYHASKVALASLCKDVTDTLGGTP